MIWRRFLWAIPLLLIVSLGVFSLELLLPGDAAIALAGPSAIPSFVLGMLGIILFSITLGWLPILGYVDPSKSAGDWLSHLVLPVLALSAPMVATLARQLRSALAEVLKEDYMRTAYAKGLK